MPKTDYEIMVDAAYNRGYAARERGERRVRNPFDGTRNEEYSAWRDGWDDRHNYEGQEWPTGGKDRDEWKSEAWKALELKR